MDYLTAERILKLRRKIMTGAPKFPTIPGAGLVTPKPESPAMTQAKSLHTTLDSAWADALSLGRPDLKQSGSGGFEASITFDTRAGSTVWARGKGTTALDALNKALAEALALKAGVVFADTD